MKKVLIPIVLIIFLSLPTIFPLFHSGFFPTDDGEWMVIRFSAFHQALREGQFPVRFLGRLNHGYGYPVANFLYPGFMYLSEPFHIMGFGFVDSIKIFVGLSMVGSSLCTFLWLRRRYGDISAVVGALFFLYTPYHLYDVYKRGSVGEVAALAIIPWILWQIERKNLFWVCIGLAILIISHNTLAILFFPIIVLYQALVAVEYKKKEGIRRVLSIVLFPLGLSAFFWIPAILELPYTRFSTTHVANFAEHFASTNLVGISSLVIFGIAIAFLKNKADSFTERRLVYLFCCLFVVSLFFSLQASTLLWNILPVGFIQFPFRILSVLILSTSFLAAYCAHHLQKKKLFPFLLLSLVALTYSALPYLQPKEYIDKGEGLYATNEDTTTVKNEYMPVWVKQLPVEHVAEKVTGVQVQNLSYNNKMITFIAETPGKAKIHTIYYPGWEAYVNDEHVSIEYINAKGVMEVPITSSRSRVKLIFIETPLRVLADLVSVLTMILLGGFFLFPRWKRLSIRNVEE